MIIDQLPLLLGDALLTDEFPIERGTTSYKAKLEQILGVAFSEIEPNFAGAYDSTSTYAVGDYVVYEHDLYVCNTSISTAEEWTAAHWTQTDIGTVLDTLSTSKQDKITASGILKGNGSTVSAATLGSDYTSVDDALSSSTTKTYSIDKIKTLTPTGLVSYAEAQTLTAAQQTQARGNIGSNWVLLWQNESPTSDFAAQTIPLDYSTYDFLAIVVKNRKDQPVQTTVIFEAKNGGGYTTSKSTIIPDGAYWQYRQGTLNSTGLAIEDALECHFAGGFSYDGVSNPTLIPLYIYGITNL